MCFDVTRYPCGCAQTTHRECVPGGLGAVTRIEHTKCATHHYIDVETTIAQRGRPLATRSACVERHARAVTGACGHSAPRSEMWRMHRYDGGAEQLVCRRCAGPSVGSPRAT